MIARDKNHPSVIMWSLANEPHSTVPQARPFFEGLYQLEKTLDPTRPVTLVSFLGAEEQAFEFCDLVCLNRYLGWYVQPGDLDRALPSLSAELDALHEKFGKPILLAEFGADAIPGQHASPPNVHRRIPGGDDHPLYRTSTAEALCNWGAYLESM